MNDRDIGRERTDKLLEELERRIFAAFSEANAEMQKLIEDYFESFKRLDAKNRERMTEEEYKQWRLNAIGRGERFIALRDKLAERMADAHEVAIAYVNDATPGIYSLNRNYAAYTIEKAYGNLDFTLWDEATVRRLIVEQPNLMPYYPKEMAVKRGIDLKYGQQQITAQVTSGILRGLSIQNMARELMRRVKGMEKVPAVRAARTATTSAENGGRQDSYERAAQMGIKVRKRWVATKDERTRRTHQDADGQTVDYDQPFDVGGAAMMFPGDRNGPAREVYQCRCAMRTVEKEGIEAEPRMIRVRDASGKNVLVSEMTYREWEEWKKTGIEPRKGFTFDDAKTIEEAISRANNAGVKYADFSGMGIDRVNNILKAVETAPIGCTPKVIGNGKTVSSVTDRKLGRKADQWYGVTYDYRPFNLLTTGIGYQKNDYDGGIVVGFNTQKFKTIESISKAKEESQEKYEKKFGRKWFYNTNGEATAFHEIGHCVSYVKGLPKGWKSISERWARESNCDMIKNEEEAFAEAYAAIKTGNDLPGYVKDAVQEVL